MCKVFFNQFVFFNSPILYSVPVRTNRCLLTSWQKSKQDTELHAVSCFSPWVWVWWTPSEDLFQRPIDVFSVTRPSPRRANGFSSAQCWMWPESRTSRPRWENTIHTSSFTSIRTDDADQQTGKNVNAACVRTCMYVCVHVRYQCIHYPLLQSCITHTFCFFWRWAMFRMLLIWRVCMYICVGNKYFLFK